MRFSTLARYFSVGGPGRMPGMKPPCLRMMSACCCGVERDRRVEVREEDDQQRVEADVATSSWLVTRLSLIELLHALPVVAVADAISAGNARIELAKITGITPDWLTFSGM